MDKSTKAITAVNKELSKVSKEDMDRLFNNSSGGLDGVSEAGMANMPLELKIIQKMTGDKQFDKPFDRKHHGMIYIKPRKSKNSEGKYEYDYKVKLEDISKKFTAKLLKVEFGVEVWRKEKRDDLDFPIKKVHARSKTLIATKDRDRWIDIYEEEGFKYTNMVKLVLTPYDAKTVAKMTEDGENPFVQLELSGREGWNTWNVISRQMTDLKKSLKVKGNLSDMLSSLFTVTLSTFAEEGNDGKTYQQFKADMILSPVTEALELEELVELFSDRFSFFSNGQDMDEGLTKIPENGVATEPVEVEAEAVPTSEGTEKKDKDEDPLEDLPF